MSYAAKDGKDTVVFVDKDYVDSQKEETVPSQQEKAADQEQQGEEKDQSAAYDPETGEINWDCPCLGGMAQGPCGEKFKAAFSCFVYSEAEPKGFDCVEKFKDMQDCFREHPDIYGDEIDDDDEEDDETTPTSNTKELEPEKDDQVAASSAFEQGDDQPTSWFSSWFS